MRGLVVGSLVVAVAIACARARAHADEGDTLVLVGGDPVFHEALADVLVDADVIDAGALASPVLGELAARSRRLADERGATITVWLAAATTGATLVTYDRTTDRLLVRELTYAPPLSATQAAEAARMVRTMLRALRSHEDAPPVADTAPSAVVTPPAPMFAASVGLGSWLARPGASVAPTLALSAAWRPHDLGLALHVALAPAATVDGMLRGEVGATAMALELRQALALTARVRLVVGAGVAVHVVDVDAVQGERSVTDLHVNPAVRGGITVGVPLRRRLEVGVSVSADCLLRRQAYEVGAEPILDVPRLQVIGGLTLGILL